MTNKQVSEGLDGLVVSTQHTGVAEAAISEDAPAPGLTRPKDVPSSHAFSRDYPDACALNVPSAAREPDSAWFALAGILVAVVLVVFAAVALGALS